MRIIAGSWDLAAASAQAVRQRREERLEAWVGERAPAPRAAPESPADGGLYRRLAEAAKARAPAAGVPADDQRPPPAGEAEPLDPELAKVLAILERLFGDREARRVALRLQQLAVARAEAARAAPPAPDLGALARGGDRAGWGLLYESETWRLEAQSAALVAEGELQLADGRRLSFSLQWVQHEVRMEHQRARLAWGDARLSDPLVLDLDGDGLRWEGRTAEHDLDGDGRSERVPLPAGADRILVLDGAVLGARTGQAFRELAALDGDGNGWIDAGDPAFARLGLWDGRTVLSLEAAGIGAIAATSVALPYRHQDADGRLQALARRAGLYLSAAGRAGAVAQVDLVT